MKRGDLRMAVEVRSEDLMTPAFARFLADHGFALVVTDRKGAPDLYDVWAEVGATVGLAMVRWIGDDRNGPKGDREITAPQDAKLDLWATRLQALESAGMEVFGYMHNPYEGHSPASVRRLLARLGHDVPTEPLLGTSPGPEDDPASQMRLL